MKKLISSLANIPFTIIAQQFPEAAMCLHTLKTVLSLFVFQSGYKMLLAMDMKTHACVFSTEKPISITKVGYRAWNRGISYSISLWELGRDQALSTSLVCPVNTDEIEFFPLADVVPIMPGKTYYITRTYVSGGPDDHHTDRVGWLSIKEGGSVFPVKQKSVTLIHGFFSDDVNPLQSDRVSNIRTTMLLPVIDFEYTLQHP